MSETEEIAHLLDRFMRRINAGVHAQASAFDTHRIGPLGGMILLTLADIEPAPITDLVRKMARDKSQMTRAIQMLERKGLVTRTASNTDARVSMLGLTSQGHVMVKGLRAILSNVIVGLLAPLEPSEQQVLRRLLLRAAE